jgi:hypothetical protein
MLGFTGNSIQATSKASLRYNQENSIEEEQDQSMENRYNPLMIADNSSFSEESSIANPK